MTDAHRQDDARMTLGEHLNELRRRILYALVGLAVGIVVALILGRQIVAVLKAPYVQVTREIGLNTELAVLTVSAGFTTYVKISLVFGLMLSSPWVFYQLWMFVSRGLYPAERRKVLIAAPFSAVLFVGGAAFFLLVVCTHVLRFFLTFSDWLGVRPVVTFGNHVHFMTGMMLVFGLSFQTPLAVLLLAKMGIVTIAGLNRRRRHVIVAALILSAVFTSPSPVDQIALAVPMWLLYELGVLLAYLTCRKDKRPNTG